MRVVVVSASLLVGCGAEVTVGPESEPDAEPGPGNEPASDGFVDPAPYDCGPMSLAQMGLDVPLCEGTPSVTQLPAGWSRDAARDGDGMRLVVTGDDGLRFPRVASGGSVTGGASLSYGAQGNYAQARGVGVDASGQVWSALQFGAGASLDGQPLDVAGEPLTLALARTSSSGELLGVATLGVTHNANHVAMLPLDDGMIVVGSFHATVAGVTGLGGGSDGFAAAFDGDGTLRWAHALGTPFTDYVRGVARAPDGTIAVVGSYAEAFGDELTPETHAAAGGLLARLSEAGELLEVGKVDDPRVAMLDDVAVLPDGSLVVVGCTKPPIGHNLESVVVARLDGAGELLWYRELGGGRGGYAGSEIELLPDGRIVVAATLGTETCGTLIDEGFPSDDPIVPHSQPLIVVLDQDGVARCATEWGNAALIQGLVAFDDALAIGGMIYGPTFGDEPPSVDFLPFVGWLD